MRVRSVWPSSFIPKFIKCNDLTRRYGVSRIPLREALQILTGEGLVKARANRGVRVRTLLPKEIDEIFCIRRLVEGDLVFGGGGPAHVSKHWRGGGGGRVVWNLKNTTAGCRALLPLF